jgi:hypothetical protein
MKLIDSRKREEIIGSSRKGRIWYQIYSRVRVGNQPNDNHFRNQA